MYSVVDFGDIRILQKDQNCAKKFVAGGRLVKFNKTGIAYLPKGVKISVCKILYHEFHKIIMAKNRQLLYHNSTIERHQLGEHIPFDTEEVLLSSLEVVEVL